MKILKYKTKNKRYVCDVDDCSNYAYAEMIRIGSKNRKGGWMYVCRKHYNLKLNKKGMPREKDVGFAILSRKEKKKI
jgi:hypothetical protein